MIEATENFRIAAPPLQPARRVLLVEDEALVAMLAEDTLRDLGFDPLWVESATDALQLLRDAPTPILAVIDVGLPDMRGDDLARQIRRDHPELGIILATGHDVTALHARFADDDRTIIMGKPYEVADLARNAHAVVGD